MENQFLVIGSAWLPSGAVIASFRSHRIAASVPAKFVWRIQAAIQKHIKLANSYFKSVEREWEMLSLIHI